MPDTEDVKPAQVLNLPEAARALPGRYRIIELLGQGGMALVYKAEDQPLTRVVAIKILLNTVKDEVANERFAREAKMLAMLNHPAIVKLLSWGNTEAGDPFLVMEYLEGTVLQNLVGNGKNLTPERFNQVFEQVLSGLAAAHEQKIVHRDLKPGNIMICNYENVLSAKIMDFGIARSSASEEDGSTNSRLTRTNTLVGSPAYMSPEQCRGAEATELSDIYSIACIMYEALCGEKPLDADTAFDVMYKHMNQAPEKLETFATDPNSKRLARLIDRCMDKDPARRPQSCQEIQHELKEIFQNRLDTGKILMRRARQARRRLQITLAASLVIVPIALACVLPLSEKNQEASSAATSKKGGVSNETEKTLKQSQRQIAGFLRERKAKLERLKQVDSEEERIQLLSELYKMLGRLSSLYRGLDDYDRAMQYAQESLDLSRKLDISAENYKARSCLNIALAKTMLPSDRKEYIKYLEMGLKCNITDPESSCHLRQHRALAYLEDGDYDNFELMEKKVFNTIHVGNFVADETLSISHLPVTASRYHVAIRLCSDELNEFPKLTRNSKDYAGVLKSYLLVCEFLLQQDYYLDAKLQTKEITRLLSRVPKTDKDYPSLLKRSNAVLNQLREAL